MKRFFWVFIVFTVLFLNLGIVAAHAGDSCPPPQSILGKLFHQSANQFTILQQQSLDGALCVAVARHQGMFQPRLFIYTKDGKYAFFGTVVNTSDAKPWGQNLIAKYSKLDPKVVASLRNIAIHVGSSKTRVVMITDPLCPFCKQMMTELKPFVAQNRIGLDIVFDTIHKGSHRLARDLLCAKHKDFIADYLNAPQLLQPQNQKNLVTCPSGAAILGEMTGALQTIGVQATPTFILERNDQVITGIVPVQALLSAASGKPFVPQHPVPPQKPKTIAKTAGVKTK